MGTKDMPGWIAMIYDWIAMVYITRDGSGGEGEYGNDTAGVRL
jgi:hypothetical protein